MVTYWGSPQNLAAPIVAPTSSSLVFGLDDEPSSAPEEQPPTPAEHYGYSPGSWNTAAQLGWKPKNKYKDDFMNDSGEYYNHKLSQVMQFRTGVQSGEVGLEVECEGVNLFNTPLRYWTCHEDGSLRSTGPHMPVEYVLRNPVKRDELRPCLEYLDAKLKEAGSKVIQSQRTSVHVHINCQKMTIRELYTFICLYMIFEELLVEWSGPDRAGNLFCLRAKDSEYYITMLESVLKQNNFKQWREDYRYSACNVASVCKFGSLEFRSMQGTVDINMIELWVNILLHLKDTAEKYDNPVEIVEEFTELGPLPFFKKIFADHGYRELFEDSPGLSGKLWDGLRLMRDVAYCCPWKKPEQKKKRIRKKRPKENIE